MIDPSHIPAPLPAMDLSASGMVACVAMASLQQIEQARAAGWRPPLTAEADPFCLFCRASDPDGGEEHILSVALGNHFWVLPPGAVCGTCNHEVLSELDTALGKHPFIALLRVLSGIPGRRGQPPSVGASNVRLRRDGNGALHVVTNHRRHAQEDGEALQVKLNWQNFGPKQHRLVSRALLKFGLGLLRLARGRDETDLRKYDHVRAAILGDASVPIRQGFSNSKLPTHALQGMALTHQRARGLHVSLDYFGVCLWAETDGAAEQASDEFLAQDPISVGPR